MLIWGVARGVIIRVAPADASCRQECCAQRTSVARRHRLTLPQMSVAVTGCSPACLTGTRITDVAATGCFSLVLRAWLLGEGGEAGEDGVHLVESQVGRRGEDELIRGLEGLLWGATAGTGRAARAALPPLALLGCGSLCTRACASDQSMCISACASVYEYAHRCTCISTCASVHAHMHMGMGTWQTVLWCSMPGETRTWTQ